MAEQTILPPCTCNPPGDIDGRGHSFGCPTIQQRMQQMRDRTDEITDAIEQGLREAREHEDRYTVFVFDSVTYDQLGNLDGR